MSDAVSNMIGKTYTVHVAEVCIKVTVYKGADGCPANIFCKADGGWQGWVDSLIGTARIAMRHGTPLIEILNHWRYQRFPPIGIAGQGCSIPDAIARRLIEEGYNKEEG